MARLAIVALVYALLAHSGTLAAQGAPGIGYPYETLYPDDTLQYWKNRYEPNLQYNLDTLILGALTAGERQSTKDRTLNLPLRGAGDPRTYFVVGSPPVITVSVASVKFLDDLAIASAWLVERGYSIETIAYYADVLKYRTEGAFTGGRYPAPLSTLGIPDDALQDGDVDHLSQLVLKSAVVFILAHEVGHLVGRHRSDASLEERVRYEMEADRFATELFRRIGVAPLGIAVFFLANTHLGRHRGDFADHQAWTSWVRDSATHPLSGLRLAALAAELRRAPRQFVSSERNPDRYVPAILDVADQLAGMAPLIDDTLLQRHAAIVGRQIPLRELQPRRPGMTWVPGH